MHLDLEVGDHVTLEVIDNGRGFGEPDRRSGIANIAHRAYDLGGTFEISQRDEGGTLLRWRVPLLNPGLTPALLSASDLPVGFI